MPTERVAVLGAGAWGATLADLLARKGAPVRVWDVSAETLARVERQRHPFGVPELKLHEGVVLEEDLAKAVAGADVIVFVVPSQAVADCSARLAPVLKGKSERPALVLASKGIDVASLRLLAEIVEDELPGFPVGAVSGPCIAREVALGVPTSVVCAARERALAVRLRDLFGTPRFRTYTQRDLIGVELGGALKNIVAIAAGIGDGLGFGANTKSALLTRGLAEMARLAHEMGADMRTIYGLAGMGDLAVTCFSAHSRNRTFGEHLGKGATADEARTKIGMTVEGEPTARAALMLAKNHNVELPITQAVVNVCDRGWTAAQAVERLMTREMKDEF